MICPKIAQLNSTTSYILLIIYVIIIYYILIILNWCYTDILCGIYSTFDF